MDEKLKILILGGGISAAFINAACLRLGYTPEIRSQAIPKTPNGCFWIHKIPTHLRGNTPFPQRIEITTVGDAVGYTEKQWGKQDDVNPTPLSSSFPKHDAVEFGYAPTEVTKVLWGDSQIVLCHRLLERDIADLATNFDVVFRTFPTNDMFARREQYLVRIPIVTYTISSPMCNFVAYNGHINDTVVRVSALFNKLHYEFVAGTTIPQHHIAGMITTVYDLHPDTPAICADEQSLANVHFVGRYAQFQRHMLAHDAYTTALDILETYA